MKVLVIVKANKDSEAEVLPSEKILTEMGKFNEELVDAGMLLSGEGLRSSAMGVRVQFSGDKRTVVSGPFRPAEEQIAGFWLWQVKSMEEAIEWAKRIPNPEREAAEFEIRPVFEADDFGPNLTPELREQEARMRARTESGRQDSRR